MVTDDTQPKKTGARKRSSAARAVKPADSAPAKTPESESKPAALVIEPALALVEFSSIANGIEAADAMVKRATLEVVRAGTVQPGRFLVLLGGVVAEVEEALKAGLATGEDTLNDHIFLPGVHPDVVRALAGDRAVNPADSLGVIETFHVPAAIHAADRGVKGAEVTLMEVRLADGLGGKGIVFFTGKVSDVEAAVEIAEGSLEDGQLVRKVVIAQLHSEMAALLRSSSRFGIHLGWKEHD